MGFFYEYTHTCMCTAVFSLGYIFLRPIYWLANFLCHLDTVHACGHDDGEGMALRFKKISAFSPLRFTRTIQKGVQAKSYLVHEGLTPHKPSADKA